MAVQQDNVSTQTQTNQSTIGQGTRQTTQSNGWGFLNAGGLGGINRNGSSEQMTKLVELFTKAYADLGVPAPYEVTILQADRIKEQGIHLSSIIVCSQAGKSSPVSFHTLLLEDSNLALQPKVEHIYGKQVEILRLTSDVYDKDYQEKVLEIVARKFPNARYSPMSAQVLPKGFNLEDKEAVRKLATNILMPSIVDLVTSASDYTPMDLTKWNRDAQLTTNVSFNDGTKTDYAGLPLRNAISLNLVASSNQKTNPNAINASEQSVIVSELGGFIDLVWTPVEQVMNVYQPMQMPQPKFAARFVMTNLENKDNMTMPSQLLALASSLALRENNNWYAYFNPRPSADKLDLRDIGALNIEANVLKQPGDQTQYGSPINTKLPSFNEMELGKFLSMAVRPGLIYSLDVSECGADTWYNEALLAAAKGNPGAINFVLESANVLTGGLFSKHYNSSASPVFVNDDRIQLGYYIDSDGQKQDVRQIDHLAVLNIMGANDPGAGEAWSQTYLNVEYPIAMRLDARRKMIMDMTHQNAKFTGYATRVTFTNDFLEALLKSCREAGLDIAVHSSAFGNSYNSQRSTFGMAQQALMVPGGAGGNTVFHARYNNAPGQTYGGGFGSQRAYSRY